MLPYRSRRAAIGLRRADRRRRPEILAVLVGGQRADIEGVVATRTARRSEGDHDADRQRARFSSTARGTTKEEPPHVDLPIEELADKRSRCDGAGDTEFKCRDGKLHLAGILDLHGRGLAGWSMATRATADIVVKALVMALARRQPDGKVIHHADRGGQYVSDDLALTMADHDLSASFGRTGVCWDNAAMESTWATIKKEIRHIHGDWESQLRTVLFDYIEAFYNRRRHQARLGHRTPAETYTASKAA